MSSDNHVSSVLYMPLQMFKDVTYHPPVISFILPKTHPEYPSTAQNIDKIKGAALLFSSREDAIAFVGHECEIVEVTIGG